MINLGSITIASGANTTFTTPSDGMQGIIIGNLSGLTCTISMVGGGTTKTLYPSTTDFFPIKKGFTGVISIVPVSTLSNVSSFSANTLIFDAVGINESINVSAYPMILPTQAINPTASGFPLFSCTVGFGSTATVNQGLNIFNPNTSGKLYTFHAARVFTNDSTNPTANLYSFIGANNALGTPQSTACHTITATNRPTSVAVCSSEDGSAGNTTDDIEVMNMQAGVTQDFLTFPDKIELYPGNNLLLFLSSGVSGKVVRMTAKWLEKPL